MLVVEYRPARVSWGGVAGTGDADADGSIGWGCVGSACTGPDTAKADRSTIVMIAAAPARLTASW